MKKHVLLLLSFVAFSYLYSQTAPPESFNFQAIIMDGNKTVKGKPIGVEISIYEGALYGTLAYQETFVQITDNNGMVSLEIGRGTPVFGDFTQILWGTNSFFIGISYDPKGGTDYIDMGGSQLLSVPYALYSKKAYALNGPNDDDDTNELQTLSLEGNVLKLTQGGEVTLPTAGIFQFYYADMDGDGFGYEWNVVYSDIKPTGYVNNGDDCDDSDSSIYPNAPDPWYDGIDQNCDGLNDYDQDGDGYNFDVDCNDQDASINPGVQEIWYDGIDQNCDGLNDYDRDGDGYNFDVDCNDQDASINPGIPEICDGIDNNCLNGIDEGCENLDTDNDGFTIAQGDCNDYNAEEFPGQIWYVDCDRDGFYDPTPVVACLKSDAIAQFNCQSYINVSFSHVEIQPFDCYDYSFSVKPNVTSWFYTPYDISNFDYNCDGTVTKRYEQTASYSYGFPESFVAGWVGGVPDCGNWGQWAYDVEQTGFFQYEYITRALQQGCN